MAGFGGIRASGGAFDRILRAARKRLARDQSFGLLLMQRFRADFTAESLADGQPRKLPATT